MKNSLEVVNVCHCEPKVTEPVLRGLSPRVLEERRGKVTVPKKPGQLLRNDVKGFTLTELVMIILLASVLSLAGYHLMQKTILNTFFLPNQVQADLVAAEALEIIVEGDGEAHGLRYCRKVSIATATQVEVTNQGVSSIDNTQIIAYFLCPDPLNSECVGAPSGTLYRKIDTAGKVEIPYFNADLTISGTGPSNALFTYYNASDVLLAQPVDPALVRRININLKAQNGTGSSDKYEGTSQQSTSIAVPKYEV